jgi:hypothetical protein
MVLSAVPGNFELDIYDRWQRYDIEEGCL